MIPADDSRSNELRREQVDQLPGKVILEFGATWCPHCQRVAPMLALELAKHPGMTHIQVEDGPGQALGRSFGVKLWPTLVFLREGQPIAQLVRPSHHDVTAAFDRLTEG